jgi:hypothetical protein
MEKPTYLAVVKISTITGDQKSWPPRKYFYQSMDVLFAAVILKEEYEDEIAYLESGEQVSQFRYNLYLRLSSRKSLTNLHAMCSIVHHMADLVNVEFGIVSFGEKEA